MGNSDGTARQWTLSALCDVLVKNGLAARVEGDDRGVTRIATLSDARDGDLSFLSNPKYRADLATTQASAVIVADGVAVPDRLGVIRAADPYVVMTGAIIAIHGTRQHPEWAISDQANIDSTAKVGDGANIGPGATVAASATIGRNATIYPGCYVGNDVEIGDDCTLFPNVVVYDHCVLGNRVTVHAGSVIGQDGLGYAPHGGKWLKIPQIGRTVVADDVEIGANCAIDRATLGQTEIGTGTKLGNVVVIGHGTKVGPDCMFVGQVGIAGSAIIGRHVILAGQAGVAGHLTIGDNVRVAGQSGVHGDVDADAVVLGSPAIPAGQARRSLVAIQKLPGWARRIKAIERQVEELRDAQDEAGRSRS